MGVENHGHWFPFSGRFPTLLRFLCRKFFSGFFFSRYGCVLLFVSFVLAFGTHIRNSTDTFNHLSRDPSTFRLLFDVCSCGQTQQFNWKLLLGWIYNLLSSVSLSSRTKKRSNYGKKIMVDPCIVSEIGYSILSRTLFYQMLKNERKSWNKESHATPCLCKNMFNIEG